MEKPKFNNFSSPPKLTELTTYRVAFIEKDPDNPGRELIPQSVSIPNRYLYNDPKNGVIEVAYIDRELPNGEVELGSISFEGGYYAGRIQLNPNNPEDHKKFAFLELSPWNGSNPKRDASKMILFYKEDSVKTAKEKRAIANRKGDALAILAGWTEAQVDGYLEMEYPSEYASLQSNDERVAFIQDQILKDPTSFIEFKDNDLATVTSQIKELEALEVIVWNTEKNSWIRNSDSSLLLAVERGRTSLKYKTLANYFVNNKEGKKALSALENESKADAKKAGK